MPEAPLQPARLTEEISKRVLRQSCCMNFYVLEKPESGTCQDRREGTDIVPAEGFNVGPAPRCPSCGRVTGMLRWLPPYRVEVHAWGEHYGDIAAAGEDLILSERCLRIFERHDVNGLCDFQPVEVVKVVRRRRKPKDKCPKYFKATVARSQTTVDQAASGMQWAPTIQDAFQEREWQLSELQCPVCLFRNGVFVRQKRLVIQPETWSGEDIFHARGGVDFVVSARFKAVCEANEIRNARFVPSEAYEVDFYPSESKQLLKYVRTLENTDYDREMRQDAYCTLAYFLGHRIPFATNFDPDRDIDRNIVEVIKSRLRNEGLL